MVAYHDHNAKNVAYLSSIGADLFLGAHPGSILSASFYYFVIFLVSCFLFLFFFFFVSLLLFLFLFCALIRKVFW